MIGIEDMPWQDDIEFFYRPCDRLMEGDIFQVEILDDEWTGAALSTNQMEHYYLYKGDCLTFLRKDDSVSAIKLLKFYLSREQRVVPMYQESFNFWALHALKKHENMYPSKWCLRKIV